MVRIFPIPVTIDAVFLWLGAKLAKIENATFEKAFIATLGGLILSVILGILIHVIGWLIGLIAFLWIVRTVFNTDWAKAIIAWLPAVIVAIAIMVILGVAVAIYIIQSEYP